MGDIIALLGQIVSRLATAIGLVNGLQTILNQVSGQVSNTALQTTLLDTENEVTLVYAVVNDPAYGNDAILTAITAQTTELLAAITTTQQSGSPVTLPTVPPPGYGGSGASAFDVWNDSGDSSVYGDGTKGFALGGLLNYFQDSSDNSFIPITNNLWVGLHYGSIDPNYPSFTGPFPDIDPTTILSTDATIGDWLNRTTGFTWVLNDQVWTTYDVPGDLPDSWLLCTMNELQFANFKAAGVTTTVLVPPVWPGLDNVTFGPVQSLVDGLTIPGPLHGIFLIITAVPYPIGYYAFGDIKSYTKVGGVVFVAGTEYAEQSQPLGLQANIVCPKSMVEADFAVLRLQSGVVGVVYPWTINS